MNFCEACGQPLPDPLATRRLTAGELNALSAWWWARTTRGASRVLRRSEQTVKNQLYSGRQRNQCRTTLELAQMFFGQLLTLEELMSHNIRGRAA